MAEAAMGISTQQSATKPLETNIDQALTKIGSGDINNPEVFTNICVNLGSTIESAIMMKAIPSSSYLHRLLFIVKEFYRCRTKFLQPCLLMLMIPLKDACHVGWFLDRDKDDLLMMENEVRYGLSDPIEMSSQQSNVHSSVSNIVSRFYPTMKVENILATFNFTAGYRTSLADFHISMDKLPIQCQNLFLIVAREDSMDTSACIIRPLNLKVLINDQEVPNPDKIEKDTGPQLPLNVTKMMKDGLNRLQVCGDVDANSGQYIIAVAFMNSVPRPDTPQLQDYVHVVSLGDDSDCEIVEMPTQISLNCPISHLRIKTPVKGHLCEHRQCFDYNYYIEINAIRPSWKCPICKNPVCNVDIRIDQEFLKILNEVAKGVNYVTISPDGSWLAGMPDKSNETTSRTKNQNNRVPDIDEIRISKEVDIAFPTTSLDSRNSGGSAVKLGAECPSTSPKTSAVTPQFKDARLQSQSDNVPAHNTPPSVQHTPGGSAVNVSAESPTPAVSQAFRDSRLLSQGSHDPVYNTPPSVNQTDHMNQNRVNLTTTPPPYPNPSTKPNHPSAESQPHVATQPIPGTRKTKKARTASLFSPIQLPPSSSSTNYLESISERVMRLTRRGQKLHTPAQSQPTPAPASAQAPASNTKQGSSTRSREPNGEMPFGIMRGSLRGMELEAARLQYRLGPQQPDRANQPVSLVPMPTPTPPEILTQLQQPFTSSKNVSSLSS